ncbi:single-stranded-DNA-specific exonuclease C-terminal domain-containing protein [Salinicoccus sp. CNSTN-B1]
MREDLPFTSGTVVLRDLPDDLLDLAYSLNGIHASKIISIFNSREELFFSGIPSQADVNALQQLVSGADDGTINLAKHAPALAGRLGVKMNFLKMMVDIMVDLDMITLKDGIIYKQKDDSDRKIEESLLFNELRKRLEAEKMLKMSSSSELKNYLRTLISK